MKNVFRTVLIKIGYIVSVALITLVFFVFTTIVYHHTRELIFIKGCYTLWNPEWLPDWAPDIPYGCWVLWNSIFLGAVAVVFQTLPCVTADALFGRNGKNT